MQKHVLTLKTLSSDEHFTVFQISHQEGDFSRRWRATNGIDIGQHKGPYWGNYTLHVRNTTNSDGAHCPIVCTTSDFRTIAEAVWELNCKHLVGQLCSCRGRLRMVQALCIADRSIIDQQGEHWSYINVREATEAEQQDFNRLQHLRGKRCWIDDSDTLGEGTPVGKVDDVADCGRGVMIGNHVWKYAREYMETPKPNHELISRLCWVSDKSDNQRLGVVLAVNDKSEYPYRTSPNPESYGYRHAKPVSSRDIAAWLTRALAEEEKTVGKA